VEVNQEGNTMKLKFESYSIPAFYVGYLFNDDYDDLTASEHDAINLFMEDNNLLDAVECADEPYFESFHDLRNYGILASDCLDITFQKRS